MKTRRRQSEKSRRRAVGSGLLDLHHACLRNADDLLEEAELLLSHGKAPRAFMLAFTALEELGKSQLVADYFNDMVAKAEFDEAFRDHRLKLKYLQRVVDAPSTTGGAWTIEYENELPLPEPQRRMDSLYVHYKERFEPVMPAKKISKEDASTLIREVREAIDETRELSYFTERFGTKAFTK